MAGRGVFVFFRGGTGRGFFFPRRDGAVVFFPRRDGAVVFFSEAGRGGFFFFFDGTGRGGVFFFFRGPGRKGCFWRWQFFWRDGAKSLHRPAKGGLNRPASRPCKALKNFPSALRVPIEDHASEVHKTPYELTGKRFRLNRALDLATQDRTPFSDRVVNATLHLRDLLEAACSTADGAQWLRDTLRAIAANRTDQADSSASDSSTTTGQRRREEPSSGRGNAKRATFSGSDSDSGPHPRRTGRDRRQVPPFIFHAAEHDSNIPSFPPRIFRPRVTQRLPPRAPNSSMIMSPTPTPPLFEPDGRGCYCRGNSRR